jgi:hypothetical protein
MSVRLCYLILLYKFYLFLPFPNSKQGIAICKKCIGSSVLLLHTLDKNNKKKVNIFEDRGHTLHVYSVGDLDLVGSEIFLALSDPNPEKNVS